MTNATDEPIAILVTALGGQGGGVLAQWLYEAAVHAGHLAQATSIPGVAQRTGATTYYLEIEREPAREPASPRPVPSLVPVPGAIDVLVASELLEAARAALAGMPSAERTLTIASTSRTLTTAEKMALGDGRFAADRLLEVIGANARRLVAFDMEEAAREAGTAVSAVMFGAIAGSGALPFGREACEQAIRASGLAIEASVRGFARGFEAAASEHGAKSAQRPAERDDALHRVDTAPSAVTLDFPAAARSVIALGHARLVEYQDARYADRYLRRLRRIDETERAIDPECRYAATLLRESARFLALWMAFDDVIRVAELKCRASRFERVRGEVGAREEDVVRLYDYFKPGVPELAGLLPPALARRAIGFDRRRQRLGKSPLALALRVRTDGAFGLLALRAVAALKAVRPRGARWHDEQAAIERWLDAIVAAAKSDWQSGYEIALAGRLVKGYGATNERGKRNLAHIVEHLASRPFPDSASRAQAIRDAREAALADESGLVLDKVMASHGAPPRAVEARPIVWIKRGRASSGRGG